MRELAAIGLSDDSRFLVARDVTSGDEFHIRADERLKSAANADRARPGQLENHMESSLNPREIQTRIRRGQSPECVADAAGVEVERIMGYAIPVLAERENICNRARNTVIRRKHVDAAGVLLGGLIDEQISHTGDGKPAETSWDSWRREDGRWTLLITVDGADAPATFIFDVQGRYVTAEDEGARQLVGDVSVPDEADMAIAEAVRADAHMRAEASPVDDSVGNRQVAADEHPEGVSSLKAARDRRAMGQLTLGEEWDPEDAASAVNPGESTPGEEEELVVGADKHPGHSVAVPDEAVSHEALTPTPRKRRERRRVPSWDEIMFGGKVDS